MRNARALASIVLPVLLFAGAAMADDTAQLIKSAKAATALAVLPHQRGSGAAFCIDPAGLFVTNAHVVRDLGSGEMISLILNPADTGEKLFKAKVVASDDDLDLALVQSTEAGKFPALPLGDVDQLFETQQLTVLGFPFGSALSLDEGKYPAISLNVVRVSSLRKSKGSLELIQLDSQLNPGNSGGPVIDSAGRVVGIVSSGIIASGINFAIPVSNLRRFMSTPRIVFAPPNIPPNKRTEPVDVAIGVVSLSKDAAPLTVQIVLNPDTPAERKVDATATTAGQYKATVVPVLSKTSGKLRALVTFGDSEVKTNIDDATIKLDNHEYKLSTISWIRRTEHNVIVAQEDGPQITGKVLTMPAINATVAGKSISIESTAFDKLVIYATAAETSTASYKIVVRRGDKVIAEQSGELGNAVVSTRTPEPATQEVSPALGKLDDAKQEHQHALDRAKKRMLDAIDERMRSIAKSGDLDAVKKIDAAKHSVELDGKLPDGFTDTAITAALDTYKGEVKEANTQLVLAYQQAIRDCTRDLKIADAEKLQAELASGNLTASGDSSNPPSGGYIKLGGENPLPAYLEPNASAFSDGEGLQLTEDNAIKTRDGTWLNGDFTFDLIYSYKPGEQGIGLVGIGEGINKQNLVLLRMHTPALADGYLGFNVFRTPEAMLTKISHNGPHLLRIAKKGDVLTVSICVDYTGIFTPDAKRSITGLKEIAPFLNGKNCYLFFGRAGLIFREVRLVKSGE